MVKDASTSMVSKEASFMMPSASYPDVQCRRFSPADTGDASDPLLAQHPRSDPGGSRGDGSARSSCNLRPDTLASGVTLR